MFSEKTTQCQPFRKKLKRIHLGFAGIWDILQNAGCNYQDNGDTNQAAAISLYAILSFIPLFILTILVISFIFGSHPGTQKELVRMIREFNPYFSDTLLAQLGGIEQKRRLLGWIGIISLVWSSSMIIGAVETAMNIIFRSREKRNYITSKLLAIGMIPMGWMVGVTSVVITYIVTLLAKHPLLTEQTIFIMPFVHGVLFRFIIPYCLTVIFFTLVYKIITTERITWGNAFAGAAIFSILMEIAKHFFTWYVSNFGQYNVVFGSLGAVVILVLWVFYIGLILLFCAELIASYRRKDLLLLEKALLKPDAKQTQINERLFRKFGRSYSKGEYMFREGDTNREMYYILAGHIRVAKKVGTVKKVLAEFGPGEYLGEMAALTDAPRTASAYATEDSDVAIIDSDTFHRLIRENEEVSLFMLTEFSNRIRTTSAALEELSQSWTKMSAIIYLIIQWPLQDDRDPIEDISAYTRKERNEIQQVLEELHEQKVLKLQNGRIVEFYKDLAWDRVTSRIFSQDRRSVKRRIDTGK
jgi:membrane protein